MGQHLCCFFKLLILQHETVHHTKFQRTVGYRKSTTTNNEHLHWQQTWWTSPLLRFQQKKIILFQKGLVVWEELERKKKLADCCKALFLGLSLLAICWKSVSVFAGSIDRRRVLIDSQWILSTFVQLTLLPISLDCDVTFVVCLGQWLGDKLVVKTTKARKRKESRFKSCAHAAFARSSFNQFTIIHKLVATTLHTLGVRLENSFFLLEHLPWILSFFSVSGLSPYSHWDVTQCIKNGNPCPPISAHFGTWKFSFLLKLLPWIFSFFLLISCSHWDVTQCMKNANPSLPSSRHFQGLEILLSSQASSMDSFFFSVFLLISCSHQDVIQCMKNVNPSLSSSWASSIRT